MSRVAIVIALGTLTVGAAIAGPIKGAGATSCGQWVEDRKIDSHYTQLNWVMGFISAYNYYVYTGTAPNGVFGAADPNAVAVWLDNYCQGNPLSTPYEGAISLVKELNARLQE